MSPGAVDEARVELAAALRLAARFDLHEGIDNHFSYSLSDGSFLVNRWGVHWNRVRAGDILQVNATGGVMRGSGTVERTALMIHGQVHVLCQHARAVFHTHMPYTTALACTNARIELISQNSLRFHGRIAYDENYHGLANDEAEGARIARALGTNSILLMRHHGALVAACSIGLAFDDLYFLERTARVQVLAHASGHPLIRVPAEVADSAARQISELDADREAHWLVLKGLLAQESPDYASLDPGPILI